MYELPLQTGQVAIVDLVDRELVSGSTWSLGDGYVVGTPNGTLVRLHRLIIGASENEIVDHINRNPLDNRRCNLRIATRSQNHANSLSQGGTSAFKGVSWFKPIRKWRATITVDYKHRTLGYFDNEEDAARAYNAAASAAWGEFAYLNDVAP